jgi:cyclic dehypoxanthinyl futalosine synthase
VQQSVSGKCVGLDPQETRHEEGPSGSANIVFGSQETAEEIVEHLRIVRELRTTGGFRRLSRGHFKNKRTGLSVPLGIFQGLPQPNILDKYPYIEASIMVLGRDTGALALHAGADDVSSVVIEENVLSSRGPGTEEKARELIRESGFKPRKRDLLYNLLPE